MFHSRCGNECNLLVLPMWTCRCDYIYPLIRVLSVRWCPMSPQFLTRRVSRLMGWLWYPGLPPGLSSIAFPFAFHISVFFHSLFIRVFLLRPTYLHHFGRPFTDSLID